MNFISPSIRPGRLRKPVVYFAGRMNMCAECDLLDWRHMIVGYDTLPDGMDEPVAPGTVVAFDTFIYGGPFLNDGTGGHAVGHGADFDGDHQRIFNTDKVQIARCDLFIAYIDDQECYGTLVEIGIAHAIGKPVIIGFCSKMPRRDAAELWFAQMAATQVYDAASPKEFWAQVMANWIDGGRS